jgi:hypothetical protein
MTHPCAIWLGRGGPNTTAPFRYCLREYWGRQWWGDLPCRGNQARCSCPYPPQPQDGWLRPETQLALL